MFSLLSNMQCPLLRAKQPYGATFYASILEISLENYSKFDRESSAYSIARVVATKLAPIFCKN